MDPRFRSDRTKYDLYYGYYWPINYWESKAPGFHPINSLELQRKPFRQFRPRLDQPEHSSSQPAPQAILPSEKANAPPGRFEQSASFSSFTSGRSSSSPSTKGASAPHPRSVPTNPHPLSIVTFAEQVDAVVSNMSKATSQAAAPPNNLLKRKYANFDTGDFSGINKHIRQMADKVLPQSPHLLAPPIDAPPPSWRNPYENIGTPFEVDELRKRCQYMTMLSDPPNRGVTMAQGGWEDEESSYNSGDRSRSGTATPGSERDAKKPGSFKWRFKDYAAAKAAKAAETEESKAEAKKIAQGETKTLDFEKLKSTHIPQVGPAHPVTIPTAGHGLPPKPPPSLNANGDYKRVEPRPKEEHKNRHATTLPEKHAPTGQAIASEMRKIAKPTEASAVKDLNTFNPKGHVTGLSVKTSGQVDAHQRPATPEAIDKSWAAGKSGATRKTDSERSQKVINSNNSSQSIDNLPPLLSPLPASLASPGSYEDPPQISAQDPADDDVDLKDSSPFSLPPLLSPTLPPEIERALKKMKSTSTNVRSSVERAYENSRQADAPGVAKKKPKQKGSKRPPPIQDHVDRFDEDESEVENIIVHAKQAPASTKKSMIIKLRYGRRNSKNINRLLALSPRSGVTKSATAHPSKPLPAATKSDKKRPHADDDQIEPSAKRPKAPTHLEVPRAGAQTTSTIRSPNASLSKQPQKPLHNNPKRGDALKSIGMGRISSSDSHVRTPGASASTPIAAPNATPKAAVVYAPNSIEKPKSSSNDFKLADVEHHKAQHTKNVELGTSLKRRMDRLFKLKEQNPGPVSETDAKLGAIVALESVAAYMTAFHAQDVQRKLERKLNAGEHWDSLLSLLPFVTSRCKAHSTLHAAALAATAVCTEALSVCHFDRLANDSAIHSSDYARFKDTMVNNNSKRVSAWRDYHELASRNIAVERIDTGTPIHDVVAALSRTLADTSTKLGVVWEKRIDF